jgi:hypothetical protein
MLSLHKKVLLLIILLTLSSLSKFEVSSVTQYMRISIINLILPVYCDDVQWYRLNNIMNCLSSAHK